MSPICPCDAFVHPLPITNIPALTAIDYRTGDWVRYRQALLRALPGETALADWRPGATGDLAVQMIEWWAYCCDVLDFYSERIANESYLRTAILDSDVRRLIRLLGYRPRPGIGAVGKLAATLSKPGPIIIPAGFQIQSKPGPGKQPQIFEVDSDTVVSQPDTISAVPADDPLLLHANSVLVQGVIRSAKVGDSLLLLERNWNGADSNWALVTVASVTPEKSPSGANNTRIALNGDLTKFSLALAANYRLVRSTRTSRPWPYPTNDTNAAIGTNSIHLDSLARDIRIGDPVLLDPGAHPAVFLPVSGGASKVKSGIKKISFVSPALVSITNYSELLWYANGLNDDPTVAPPNSTPPIVILHSQLGFTPAVSSLFNIWLSQVQVVFGWKDVGTLIGTPTTAYPANGSSTLTVPPNSFPLAQNISVQIEDTLGTGENLTVANPPNLTVLFPDQSLTLKPPLTLYSNLLSVSRGKSVIGEVLGTGDATIPGQEFVLKNSPLTYLMNRSSVSGDTYQSTLRVWVNGIEWKEVPSFYGQPSNATIFTTREDDSQKTHVLFGDGVSASLLPSGASVIANYRSGSGADAPAPGSLTVILNPIPGIRSIRNPVAVGGGADPDPAGQIRQYAPQSVLTFGRAVSGDDYETIAAQAPGVARARAYWSFDPDEQRTTVTVYVGDDSAALDSARAALNLAHDPNRPLNIRLATPVPAQLTLTLRIDPSYDPTPVVAAATAALIDPVSGLFGTAHIRIGGSIFESQVYDACLRVPGTLAVHNLQFTSAITTPGSFRFDPGEAGFFELPLSALTIHQEIANAG